MGGINPRQHLNHNPAGYSYTLPGAQPYTYEYSYKPLAKESLRDMSNTLVVLINSVYYFLECVYILERAGNFQLVVIHNNRVLTYRSYSTLKGAKIAFQKLYKDKVWQRGIKPDWTHPYEADYDWLEEKDEILDRSEFQEPLKAYSI